MKVLYVDLQYDYGIKERGENQIGILGFKASLEKLGHTVENFYWDKYLQQPEKMQAPLKEKADKINPDLIFFCLFKDHFQIETLNYLKSKYNTVNWFGDDSWRFDNFTKKYANSFTYCITTDKFSIEKYRAIGQENVIESQWAAIDCTPPTSIETTYQYDVSFVGAANYYRRWFVKQLIKNGINVQAFGHGWDNGPLTLEKMRETFSKSKINLNLSNSKSFDIRYIFSNPINLAHTLKTTKTGSQIKARTFEIPYYGGFQLTDYSPALDDYFQIGKELACYRDIDEAILLINYYLANDKKRERMKRDGHLNAVKNHNYLNRFEKILNFISSSKRE